MLSGEVTNTSFIVFGLTRSGLQPTIYCTPDDHANNYTTKAFKEESTVSSNSKDIIHYNTKIKQNRKNNEHKPARSNWPEHIKSKTGKRQCKTGKSPTHD